MIINFPPNGGSQSKISFSVRSNASKRYLFVIGVSSQIMAASTLISFARSFCFFIWQMEFRCTSKGKLNRDCAVLPPDNNVAAIPDNAVAKTNFRLFLKVLQESQIMLQQSQIIHKINRL